MLTKSKNVSFLLLNFNGTQFGNLDKRISLVAGSIEVPDPFQLEAIQYTYTLFMTF